MADGITNVVYNVTKELARRGHQVEVYASDMLDLHGKDSLYAKHLVINGVNVHYSRSLWRYKTFIITPSIVPLLSKNIDNFDIIHIHDCRSFQGISTYLLAKTKNIPYVFQPHGSYLTSLPESLTTRTGRLALDKFISGKIVKNASKVIALNRTEAQQYRSMGVPEEKIEVIPNGIDLSEYADLPPKGCFKKKFGIDEDEKIVLYLGRIHESKGLYLLAEAFSIISRMVESTRLVIVGPDDGYASTLFRLILNLGIEETVIFLGFIDKRDKMAALVDSDVFVTPRFDGFPVTFLEACVAGCPIVTTSNDLDWIQSNVGYVTDKTTLAFSKAIIKILLNEQIREEFRANSVETIRKFAISATTSQIENRCYSIATNHKF